MQLGAGTRQSGFTLIEMLLSVAIIGMLAGLSMPVYETFIARNDLDIATQTIATTLRRAENYARAGNKDSGWSVEIQSTVVTLFLGTNFAGRDTNYDETYSIPSSMTPSGLTEVQFAVFTGIPNTTTSLVLTSSNGDTKTITLSAKGVVDY